MTEEEKKCLNCGRTNCKMFVGGQPFCDGICHTVYVRMKVAGRKTP